VRQLDHVAIAMNDALSDIVSWLHGTSSSANVVEHGIHTGHRPR
jgi:hypothetical protein